MATIPEIPDGHVMPPLLCRSCGADLRPANVPGGVVSFEPGTAPGLPKPSEMRRCTSHCTFGKSAADSARGESVTYAMKFLGLGDDKRLRWRGTGFCPYPGGMTYIDDMAHWIAAQAVQRRLDREQPKIGIG